MNGSVGQMLRDARLEKNLTVEEVSRATKIRPARIDDLESDDYSRFPNLAYARSFLLLYAKYLGVDISKYPTVEPGSAVGLGDYQYLQSEEAEKVRHSREEPSGPPKKPRWLIAFFVFLAMLLVGAYIGWGIMNYLRLRPAKNHAQEDAAVLASPTPTPSATPLPSPSPTVTPVPAPEAVTSPDQPAEAVAVAPSPELEVRRAEPLTGTEPVVAAEPVAAPSATPAPSPDVVFPPQGTMREVKLRVTKRTKVRIVRDKPNASSIYYGYVNPAQPVLTYKGKYFWIQTNDPDAVKVTVDGQPVSGPESGVEILRSTGL